jgi:tRNA (cmo5U34)-methyltransferase
MGAMSKIDNATAHPADEYDGNIRKSIPLYDQFHQATIDLVSSVWPSPQTWIDVGCGTGTLVEKAHRVFPTTEFVLADPSKAMLELATEKLKGRDRISLLQPVTAEELRFPKPAAVVTAIQSLHYLNTEQRRMAVRNCFHQMQAGGLFVTFENIRPLTDRGTEIGKENWKRSEIKAGKPEEEARKHVERFGTEFFPITIEAHLKLLREIGFELVELLWYSYVQAGFYCIK